MLLRLLIVLAAYGLSFIGFMLMLIGTGAGLSDGMGWMLLLPLAWLFAWVCHVRMCIGWVRDLPVAPGWARWGTAAGLLSLLSPFLMFGAEGGILGDRVGAAATTVAIVGIFFLPCIALAIHLVRFHLASQRG